VERRLPAHAPVAVLLAAAKQPGGSLLQLRLSDKPGVWRRYRLSLTRMSGTYSVPASNPAYLSAAVFDNTPSSLDAATWLVYSLAAEPQVALRYRDPGSRHWYRLTFARAERAP
jgi:hypothetical protein